MRNKMCSGCLTYITYLNDEAPKCIMTDQNWGDCPCAKCVVKIMCEETCYEFDGYKMRKEALSIIDTPRSNPFIKGGI